MSEDEEHNLWDDILDEQLSKCPPVRRRATWRTRGNFEAGGDCPSIVATSDEPVIVTGDREGEGEQATAEEKDELNEQEIDSGERDAQGGAVEEEGQDTVEEGAPRQSSSRGLRFDPKIPSFGLLHEDLQQQEQEQEQQKEAAAVGLSLAPRYASLLTKACGSMLDIIQGANVDSSLIRTVNTAAAAASAAQVAVSEAMTLLDKHLATLSDGTSTRSELPRSLSPSSLSSSTAGEAAAQAARRGAENSSLLHGAEEEGDDGHNTERPEGGHGGGKLKHLSSNFDVDVGAWNWAEVGGDGGAVMDDDARKTQVLKDEKEGGHAGEGRRFTGKWGVGSHQGHSAGAGAGLSTAAALR